MAKVQKDLLLNFEIPDGVRAIMGVPIYERGTRNIIGVAEFAVGSPVSIYFRAAELYERINEEDLKKRLNGMAYNLERPSPIVVRKE